MQDALEEWEQWQQQEQDNLRIMEQNRLLRPMTEEERSVHLHGVMQAEAREADARWFLQQEQELLEHDNAK